MKNLLYVFVTEPMGVLLWTMSPLGLMLLKLLLPPIDLTLSVLISHPRVKWGMATRVKNPKHALFMVCEHTLKISGWPMATLTHWNNVWFHRARLVNYIKTSEVIRQPYPLQIRSSGPHSYFMKRETWGWTDFLMNPMVRKYIE